MLHFGKDILKVTVVVVVVGVGVRRELGFATPTRRGVTLRKAFFMPNPRSPGKLLRDRSQDLAEEDVRSKFDQPWITGL